MDESAVRHYWECNAPTWTRLSRAGYDVCRDNQTSPAFFEMLPDVNGLTGLDIGCGEGYNTRRLAARGARVVALDIAPTFLRAAAGHEESRGIHYLLASALPLPFPARTFDFVTAFMSLMDVAGPEVVFPEIVRVLNPGGFLQFSILHPCFCSMVRRVVRDEAGKAVRVEVGRYFERVDGEIERWIFNAAPPEAIAGVEPFAVPRFHRTLADWLNTIAAAGLRIEWCAEPAEGFDDTLIAPNFLLMRCRLQDQP
jgi:ubiquinone/menaquinone biosynthesis C-methylase UbiE